MIGVIEMMFALILIFCIIISSGFRVYFRRKYDPSEYRDELNAALERHHNAKTRLHNAQTK